MPPSFSARSRMALGFNTELTSRPARESANVRVTKNVSAPPTDAPAITVRIFSGMDPASRLGAGVRRRLQAWQPLAYRVAALYLTFHGLRVYFGESRSHRAERAGGSRLPARSDHQRHGSMPGWPRDLCRAAHATGKNPVRLLCRLQRRRPLAAGLRGV